MQVMLCYVMIRYIVESVACIVHITADSLALLVYNSRFFNGSLKGHMNKKEGAAPSIILPPKGKLSVRRRAYQGTKRIEGRKFGCKNLKIFAFIFRKEVAKACFYSTLNLKRLGSFNKRHFVYSVKMKREELSREVENTNKADSAAHVGNKVLPITEAPLSSSTETNDRGDTTDTKDQTKRDKKKPISRMKELLRWAASAKSEKGGKFNGRKVLMFRKRGTSKSVPDDDQVSSDSPKISFRWDVESCSAISSAYSAISAASSLKNGQNQFAPSISIPPAETSHFRKGNWITTDSEFVVLEL